jgi:uncharacterized protein
MSGLKTNKLKIFNDPVYGFINVPDESVFDLIEDPFFQRLRYIKQLGMTHLVFPGALHTRFHHAMGAMYLTTQAIEILRFKGNDISQQEALSTTQAILLHDIGHGPFSHALEHSLVNGLTHEDLSALFMERLNKTYHNRLSEAISIFNNTHAKPYLHQLIAGQLDMDRLDYLNRDSFFTGVSEGVVSWDRIIKMLNISGQHLVIDEKGIYSIEKFLIARRLMYWQVYLHKTVIASEKLLTSILQRAKELAARGEQLFSTPALARFLYNSFSKADFRQNPELLNHFALLDDHDIVASIKAWTTHSDKVLSTLCNKLINRRLLRIQMQQQAFEQPYIDDLLEKTAAHYKISPEEAKYFVVHGSTRNNAYDPSVGNIWILMRDGTLKDIAEASDQLNIQVLSQTVEKFYLCSPKEIH